MREAKGFPPKPEAWERLVGWIREMGGSVHPSLRMEEREGRPRGVFVAAGAVLDLNGFSEGVQTLSGAGTVDFGGGALTLGGLLGGWVISRAGLQRTS